MARSLTMGEIVRRCLRRVDFETNGPFSVPEVKALISEMYGQLYSIVVQSGYRYFEANQVIIADGSTSYDLPSDHDWSIGLDRNIDATGTVEQLDELMIQERDWYGGMTGEARYYSLVGQSLVMYPRPLSGTYTYIYVPQSPDISGNADEAEIDVVTSDGEAFLIYGVCVKLTAKTELDPRMLIQERDAAQLRFASVVGQRALINPRRRVVRPTPDWEMDVY